MSDPFDPKNLRLDDTALQQAKVGAAKAGATQRSRQPFVMLTLGQANRLGEMASPAVRVFLQVLFLTFKARGRPVKLANAALAELGVNRKAKWRALRELEARGLTVVTRHPRKSPEISLTQE
jgi:hypothetical protein